MTGFTSRAFRQTDESVKCNVISVGVSVQLQIKMGENANRILYTNSW